MSAVTPVRRRASGTVVVGGVTALTFVVACFSKPSAPHSLDDAALIDAPGSPGDGRSDAPSTTSCDIAHDDYEAPASNECGDWATNVITGGVTKTRNAHDVTITVSSFGTGECPSTNPFKMTNGASLRIVAATLNPTYFRLYFVGGTAPQVGITYMNTSLQLTCPGGTDTTVLPIVTLPEYVRLTAVQSGPDVQIKAYYSDTNGPWTQFNTCTLTNLPLTTAYGVFGGSGSNGSPSSTFDDFNTYMCPPP